MPVKGGILSPESIEKRTATRLANNNGVYQKGGFTHSEEAKARQSKRQRGTMIGEENPFFGKKHSPETIERIKSKLKGRHLSPELKMKLSIIQTILVTNLWKLDEYRKSHKWDSKKRANQSRLVTQYWQDDEYANNHLDAFHLSPNKVERKLELILNNLMPNEWKFVGDGSCWFNRMNPDFLNINGQKKIIELFGDYWHRGETGENRINNFAKYGFKTLIVWENEMVDNDLLSNKILLFAKEGE